MYQTYLFVHLIGFGVLFTVLTAGFILDGQYRKAKDFQSKAALLRALRPIGLLSPIALVLLLFTGIANMYTLQLGLFDVGWLTAKIFFFALAAISGITFGAKSRKRGTLVQQMAMGEAPADAETNLKKLDKQQRMFYLVNSLLLLIILYLSVFGRHGGPLS